MQSQICHGKSRTHMLCDPGFGEARLALFSSRLSRRFQDCIVNFQEGTMR